MSYLSVDLQSHESEHDQDYIAAVWERRYVALRAARHGSSGETTEADQRLDTVRGIVARIGTERFALPMTQVTEVVALRPEEIGTAVPDAPPEFWGLIVMQGEVRPVFDLGRLLNVPAEAAPTDGGHIIFVRESATHFKDEIVGLKTDRAEEIVLLPVSEGENSPSESLTGKGRFIARTVALTPEAPLLQIIDIAALLTYLYDSEE